MTLEQEVREILEKVIIHDEVDLHHFRMKGDNCQYCQLVEIEISKATQAILKAIERKIPLPNTVKKPNARWLSGFMRCRELMKHNLGGEE